MAAEVTIEGTVDVGERAPYVRARTVVAGAEDVAFSVTEELVVVTAEGVRNAGSCAAVPMIGLLLDRYDVGSRASEAARCTVRSDRSPDQSARAVVAARRRAAVVDRGPTLYG